MNSKIEYYHFIGGSSGGDRYFRVDWMNNKVIQVVADSGSKKGRPHMLGVFRIAESSFRGTYHWHFGRKKVEGQSRMLLTTENQFNIAKERVLKFMLPEYQHTKHDRQRSDHNR